MYNNMDISKTISSATKSADILKYGVFGILIILTTMIIYWIYNKSTLRNSNCQSMNTLYSDFAKVHSINTDNEAYSLNLRDYYIKTAYNACSAGQFKNDFVDTCALKNCIKQGVRCLDFEIYSVNNSPVIATSSVDDYTTKETYNSVSFADMLSTVNDYAFSGGTCPNPNDPLILHFRIMSNNTEIYSTMATQLESALSDRLLGSEYSYENHGENLGKTPLKDLLGKVIIIVDKSNPLFEKTPLDEYVNIASNSVYMRALRYSDGVKYTPDMDELIEFNQKCMSICLPDISSSDANYSASLAIKCGCQMVAMCVQNFDSNMEYYDMFFDEVGTAFVLKPEALRYIPVTVDAPTTAPDNYSFKERSVSTNFYNFTI